MKNSKKGFTLIELLVVIAIIGLLSTLAVVALNSARQRSRDAKRVADIRQIQTALELAFSETNDYPGVTAGSELGASGFTILCADADSAHFTSTASECTGTTFMGLVPEAPEPPSPNQYLYTGLVADGSSNCTDTAGCANYRIVFELEGGTGQLTAASYPASFCADPDGIVAGTSC